MRIDIHREEPVFGYRFIADEFSDLEEHWLTPADASDRETFTHLADSAVVSGLCRCARVSMKFFLN